MKRETWTYQVQLPAKSPTCDGCQFLGDGYYCYMFGAWTVSTIGGNATRCDECFDAEREAHEQECMRDEKRQTR